MNRILDFAIEKKCSDIFIDEGKCGALRLKRETHINVSSKPITRENMLAFFQKYCPGDMQEIQETIRDANKEAVDTALEYAGRRFRVNICMTNNGLSCVFRLLNAEVPDITSLNLPDAIRRVESLENGLVLVVGETGSGKTMSLAGLIEEINRTQKKNIITIEDPIEYTYTEKKSRISQREVGRDTPSFTAAIKSALRSAPDICLVGELRDYDTIKAAIELAETGHLVFATLHSKGCTDTPDRLVDVFPATQQQQVRVELAGVLRTVIHQRLIKSYKNEIVPLCEIMVVNPMVATGIKDHNKWRSSEVHDYMRANSQLGNVHIIDNAIWHLTNDRVNMGDISKHLESEEVKQVTDIMKRLSTR